MVHNWNLSSYVWPTTIEVLKYRSKTDKWLSISGFQSFVSYPKETPFNDLLIWFFPFSFPLRIPFILYLLSQSTSWMRLHLVFVLRVYTIWLCLQKNLRPVDVVLCQASFSSQLKTFLLKPNHETKQHTWEKVESHCCPFAILWEHGTHRDNGEFCTKSSLL